METLLTVDDINKLIHNPVTWVILAWAARELYRWLSKSNRELVTKMSELTIAIVRLETKLESIERVAYSIPKLEKDVSALHSKFRQFDSNSTST